ncbi:CCA tRNA nucleotidyltransferase [Aliiruegeria sabulilitoris]|uniref:CCA tRNA nucleotidyltransferase n=1 Tax=Aliiruegeria sabulilitoris TaxID=1510458 RepID=UPI0008301D88|nr:CCA tRNA nucleotidyltransferase [Aliiruegeria sabulilitoris]NDR57508.1 CCA tRNA nucleotidyltransferase [Pseudoruegeria sp. M32A2M]
MKPISAPWLESPAVQHVCKLLEAGGYRALFVGGCVRNTLLGFPVSDHDLSTDAPPKAVIALMHDAGLKVIPTGIEHGTVTVIVDDEPFEITTFRLDVATDGRRAVVHFSTNVVDDAHRRDFTMNAIYCDRHGEIFDPLDGLADLNARRLRFVGTAVKRVREDYLRILRFFRFSAWYADPEQGMDPEALDACSGQSDGLRQISAERIGAEMRKLLSAPEPSQAVSVMQTTGVLPTILPGADVTALPIVVHIEQQLGRSADPVLRLAALGGEDVANRLRLSRKDARKLERISDAARSGMSAREMGYRLGAADGPAAVILYSALMGVSVSPKAMEDAARGAKAEFPVRAKDLMPDHAGPEIGTAMKAMERRWIESSFQLSRAELLSESSQ